MDPKTIELCNPNAGFSYIAVTGNQTMMKEVVLTSYYTYQIDYQIDPQRKHKQSSNLIKYIHNTSMQLWLASIFIQ